MQPPRIHTAREKSMERIEELLEELVLDTVATALSHLINRNQILPSGAGNKTCHNPNCPYDIKF